MHTVQVQEFGEGMPRQLHGLRMTCRQAFFNAVRPPSPHYVLWNIRSSVRPFYPGKTIADVCSAFPPDKRRLADISEWRAVAVLISSSWSYSGDLALVDSCPHHTAKSRSARWEALHISLGLHLCRQERRQSLPYLNRTYKFRHSFGRSTKSL